MERIDGVTDEYETAVLRTSRPNASFAGTTVSPNPTAMGGWFEAMAKAWGNTLDDQAGNVGRLSQQLGAGLDTPSQLTMLSAESMRMRFLSESASTSMKSVAQALEALARKQ